MQDSGRSLVVGELQKIKMVAGLNLDGLANLTPIVINTSIVDNPETMIPNTLANSNTLTQDLYGLLVMIVLFLVLTYILAREDEVYRLDFVRASLIAAGIVTSLGVVATITTIFNDFRHVVWFLTIVVIALIAAIQLKQKGQ